MNGINVGDIDSLWLFERLKKLDLLRGFGSWWWEGAPSFRVSLTSFVASFDHWIAFALLSFIGLKMIKESFGEHSCGVEGGDFSYKIMLPLAIATSIDALAVGVSLAVLDTHIFANALCIGVVTAIFSVIALKIGNRFGLRFASRAELFGGIILVLIGVKILVEHLIEGI